MRSVQAAISVATTPEKALHRFSDAESMRAWWGVERGLVEARAGGVRAVTCGGGSPAGFRYASTAIIEDHGPGERLELGPMPYFNAEWAILGPMQFSVRVEGRESETTLAVRQSGHGEGEDWNWYYESVADGWPLALEAAQRHLEGRAET